MTRDQIKHYLLGGKFEAIYNPPSLDISSENKRLIGSTIEVYQNCLNTPVQHGEYDGRWEGQYRFTSPSIGGWFPEEDIQDLKIIDEFLDEEFIEPSKQYCYKLTYTEEKQVRSNFGKGFKAPIIVCREYSTEKDEYVLKLSNPQATKIEKRIVDILNDIEEDWVQIL